MLVVVALLNADVNLGVPHQFFRWREAKSPKISYRALNDPAQPNTKIHLKTNTQIVLGILLISFFRVWQKFPNANKGRAPTSLVMAA